MSQKQPMQQEEKNKSFGIGFGALSDTIGKQIKQQGYKYNEEKVKHFEKVKDAIITLMFSGIMADSICDKLQKKLYNQIATHIEKCNKVKITKLK